MTNPFSKDYVSQVKIDHKDRTYKRPVLNQPPRNSLVTLIPKSEATLSEKFRRLSLSEI
jgi:hypothetical protein